MTGDPQRPCPPLPPDPIMMLPSRLIVQLAKTARRLMTQAYPEDPLRFPRVLVLAALAQHGPLSQREVSEAIDIDPGDVVGMVDALEELGFLTRERDPRDRRRYALELTKAGRAALHERRNFAVRMNETLFAGLDPSERSMLESLLHKALAYHDGRFAADHPASAGNSGPGSPARRVHDEGDAEQADRRAGQVEPVRPVAVGDHPPDQ